MATAYNRKTALERACADCERYRDALRRVMNQSFWDPEMGVDDVISIAEEALGETRTRPPGPPRGP